ncbi:hypothetical protein JOM56_007246 [Amanita muscaria]
MWVLLLFLICSALYPSQAPKKADAILHGKVLKEERIRTWLPDKPIQLTIMLPSSSPTLTGRQQSEDVALSQEPEDDVLLARLGYKGEFRRAFSVRVPDLTILIMGGCSSVSGTYLFRLIAGGHVGMYSAG